MKVAIAYFIISGLYVYIGFQYWGKDHTEPKQNADENITEEVAVEDITGSEADETTIEIKNNDVEDSEKGDKM